MSAALCGRVEETAAAAQPSARGNGSGCVSGGGDAGRGAGGGVDGFRLGNEHPCRRSSEGGKGREVRRRALSKQEGAMAAAQASAAASQSGVFSARLCVHGVWKEYILDDFFPCLAGGGGPCLSRAHSPAMWVSMLQKAYARAMGSYSAALKGCCLPSDDGTGGAGVVAASLIARPAEVLGVFTGAPVLQVKIGSRGRAVSDEKGEMAGAGAAAVADVEGDPSEPNQAAGELWGSIVSLPGASYRNHAGYRTGCERDFKCFFLVGFFAHWCDNPNGCDIPDGGAIMQINVSFLRFFSHPGALTPMDATTPMGAITWRLAAMILVLLRSYGSA